MNCKNSFILGILVLLLLAITDCRNNEESEYKSPPNIVIKLYAPPTDATDVNPRVLLGWSIYCEDHTINDSTLYFGTDSNPPFLAKVTGQYHYHFRPDHLELNRTYYWKIAVTEQTPAVESTKRSFSVTPRDRTLWNYNLGQEKPAYSWWASSPLVYGDRVYQLSTSGSLNCLDAVSGTLLWTTPTTESYLFGIPRGAEGKIYLPGNKQFYCLDAMTGVILWTFSNSGYSFNTPCIQEDKIYCNTGIGIFCLDARTGSEIWRTDRIVRGSICLEKGRIFVGTQDQNGGFWVECLDAVSRLTLWKKYVISTYNNSKLIVVAGKLFFSLEDILYCYNTEDGVLNWKFESKITIPGVPFVFNGKVFLTANDNHYVLLDALNGKILWETEAPVPDYTNLINDPVLAGNSLILADECGYVFCLELDTGNILWKYFVSPSMHGVALLDKLIYVAGEDEYLYCLKIE